MDSAREHMWLWGHEAGSHNDSYGLPAHSRMTPVEGACYMGLPNLIMIRYSDVLQMPYDQYALAMRSLKRVYWSTVGGGGITSDNERAHVIDLAKKFPNIVGVFMDDFFHEPKTPDDLGILSLAELRAMRAQLTLPDRQLKLGVTLYTHQLDLPLTEYLAVCDQISLWTWEAPNLANLEANMAKLEQLAPGKSKLLGLYMWDYGLHQPMPLDAMQKQCETALTWLQSGRIDGMIFLASCICDLGLEAVEWSREWIARVGEQPINRS